MMEYHKKLGWKATYFLERSNLWDAKFIYMSERICSLSKDSDNSRHFEIRGKNIEYFEYWNFNVH